jgi:hypothetical protein
MSEQRQRPSAWFWVAGVLMVLGVASGVAGIFIGIKGFVDKVDAFQRVVVPAGGEVTLESGPYTLYAEGPGRADGVALVASGAVTLTSPDGQPVTLSSYDGEAHYGIGGHDGTTIATFDAPAPGAYRLAVAGDSGSVQTLAVGRGLGLGPIGVMLGGIGLGAVAFLAGFVILLIAVVKQSDANRRQREAAAYGGAQRPPGW